MSSPDIVFAVQDETGTVYQLNLLAGSPTLTFSVGDTGIYAGTPDEGTDGFAPTADVTCPFRVVAVNDGTHIVIGTLNQSLAFYPRSGLITWETGANATLQTAVDSIDAANAYMTVREYRSYWLSRGVDTSISTDQLVKNAIVEATDYLDQRYTYSGTKSVQNVGASQVDANAIFLQPWLFPGTIINVMNPLTPATSPQITEWPRQGVIDRNGLTVNGMPVALKKACAELASRVLEGTILQPDYDPNVVTNGAVVESFSNEVGPIRVSKTFDTKLGLGFFPDFPQVTRILRSAGLLKSGGRRTIMR